MTETTQLTIPDASGPGFNPKAWHVYLQTLALESQPDWLIYTDGSGHKDLFGGCSTLAVGKDNNGNPAKRERAAGLIGTTTEAAEFYGLLFGLGAVYETHTTPDKGQSYKELMYRLERKRPTIHWITDRESLALAVFKHPENGNPVYRRSSTPHLWAWFEFFEPFFRIIPLFYGRNTDPLQAYTDEIASELRLLVKDYHGLRVLDMKSGHLTA